MDGEPVHQPVQRRRLRLDIEVRPRPPDRLRLAQRAIRRSGSHHVGGAQWTATGLPDGADVFLNHDARLEASTTRQIKVLHDGPSGTTSVSISEPLVVEGANATGEPQAGHRR